MKIITLYELLGLVKDGKAPKIIKYRNDLLKYNEGVEDYIADGIEHHRGNYLFHYLFEEEVSFLNDEVEIIENTNEITAEQIVDEELKNRFNASKDTSKEEKKIPEKLGECAYVDGEIAYSWSKSEAILKTRINEIIDYLDYLKSKGE